MRRCRRHQPTPRLRRAGGGYYRRESGAHVVTGVSPVVSQEAQDAADTAATTEEGAIAHVVTGACPDLS